MTRDLVSFVVPVRTHSKLNQRVHWAVRAKQTKAERDATWVAAIDPVNKERPVPPCVVSLTRVAPRELDNDNLRGALKAVRDEVAKILGVNDRDPSVKWEYWQERGKPKQYAVRIDIRPVADSQPLEASNSV